MRGELYHVGRWRDKEGGCIYSEGRVPRRDELGCLKITFNDERDYANNEV